MIRHNRILRVALLVAILLAAAGGVTLAMTRCSGTGTVICTATVGRNPIGVDVDPRSGHAFVVNRDSGTVSMIDARTGAVVHTTSVGTYALGPVVASSAGRVFVYKDDIPLPGVRPTVLTMLDARSGDVAGTINIGVVPTSLAVDDRVGLLFVGTMKWQVVVIDAHTGRIVRRIPTWGAVQRIVFDTNRSRAFFIMDGLTKKGLLPIAPGKAAVSAVDIATGRVLRTVAIGQSPYAAAVDSRTARLFVVNADDNTVSVLDTHSGSVLHTITLGAPIRGGISGAGMAIDTRAGHVVVVTTHDAAARLLDARTGKVLKVIRLGSNPDREWWGRVVVDEQSDRAFATGGPGTRVIDTRSGNILRTISASGMAMALDSRTGHVFVTSGMDTTSLSGMVEIIREIVSKDGSNTQGSVSTLNGRG